MYSSLIIQHSDISNYSLNNQRDIVLDTADNLTQIGNWTLTCFKKEKDRIELREIARREKRAVLGKGELPVVLRPQFRQLLLRKTRLPFLVADHLVLVAARLGEKEDLAHRPRGQGRATERPTPEREGGSGAEEGTTIHGM